MYQFLNTKQKNNQEIDFLPCGHDTNYIHYHVSLQDFYNIIGNNYNFLKKNENVKN